MEQFFTRSQANEGIKLPLALPDGTPTEHYLTVLGVDSDAFRLAEADQRRRAPAIAAIDDEKERLEAINASKFELIASLVSGWSFDKPCTARNVLDFFREAPQIADQVDAVAGRRSLFFALKRSGSSDTPNQNGGSPQSQQDQK